MDTVDAYIILSRRPEHRGQFRAAWVFENQRYAEAHLRRADDLVTRRCRRPLPSETHVVLPVRLVDPEAVDATNFIPAAAIVKKDSTLFDGNSSWHNIRLLACEKAALRVLETNYDPRRFALVQVALMVSPIS